MKTVLLKSPTKRKKCFHDWQTVLGRPGQVLLGEGLQADPLRPRVQYWRDKDQHEVDFVIPCGRRAVNAIECKWDAGRFDPSNLRAFRALHPEGVNFVVAANVMKPHTREVGGMTVTIAGIDHEGLASPSGPSPAG